MLEIEQAPRASLQQERVLAKQYGCELAGPVHWVQR